MIIAVFSHSDAVRTLIVAPFVERRETLTLADHATVVYASRRTLAKYASKIKSEQIFHIA